MECKQLLATSNSFNFETLIIAYSKIKKWKKQVRPIDVHYQ